jgi:hypothetical protein
VYYIKQKINEIYNVVIYKDPYIKMVNLITEVDGAMKKQLI